MGNFFSRIAEASARAPDRIAIEFVGAAETERTSYGALLAEAEGIAAWLTGTAGLEPGDRAAILSGNDARWVAVYLGAMRAGIVSVPLDTAYSATQVATVLEHSGARVLFVSARYEDIARAAAPPTVRVASLQPSRGPDVRAAGNPAVDERERPRRSCTSEVFRADDGDAAVMLYTSGTTADPKGVVLTHANLDAERAGAFQLLEVTDADVVLGVLPLFHALAQMANLLLPLSAGGRVIFLETVNSSTLLDALGTRDVTVFACVPQFFYLIHQRVSGEVARRGAVLRGLLNVIVGASVRLRDATGWNPGRLIFARVHRALGPRMRLLITGGSRFDPMIGRELYGMGFSLLNAYGLTETSGGATITRVGDRFTTSVGQPFPGVEIRIDRTAASDEDGEVLIKGPIVMREYFGRVDATSEALRNGWLYTGDLGRLDGEGRLYITGRKKEIIVLSSGKNLYPEEIEAHYRRSPFIKEICVLGISRPGEPASERLHAVVVPDETVLRERGIVNLRELVRFELEGLSVQLPAHKRVLGYDISLEPLPRTTTGKVKRKDIERQVASRASEGVAARAVTTTEREWLDAGDHANAVTIVAARLNRASVLPDANLELDLGLDSMERVELLTVLEQRRGRRVTADVRAQIFTVRQMIDAVDAAPPDSSATESLAGLPWDAVLAEPPDPVLVSELTKSKVVRAAACYLLLRLARAVMRIWVGLRVTGDVHLPARGPLIVSPNHQTFFDGFVVASALPFRLFRQIFFVGATQFFDGPLRSRLARAVNIVPIDPDANLVTAMGAAATGLRLGKVLILFPEGERSIDGEVKIFRKGAAILASHLQVPVAPVGISGLYRLWPRGHGINWRACLPWRADRARVRFGPPLQLTSADYTADTARLRQSVSSLVEPSSSD